MSRKSVRALKPDFIDSRGGQIVLAAVLLPLAYIWASWAIDSGSYWHYLLAISSFVWGVRSVYRVIIRNGKN